MRARHTVLSGPHYIPDSLYTCLCQVHPLYSHIIFYPFLYLTSFLPKEAPERQPAEDRRQNQTTVIRTRRPLREPDDDRLNDQPANTINDSINRSTELTRALISARRRIKSRPPREAPQTTTIRMYSQRTAIGNDSNQSEPSIGPTPPPN